MKLGIIQDKDFHIIRQALLNPLSTQEIILSIMLETGCRTDEALKLSSSSLNLPASTIAIKGSKSSSDRAPSLTPTTINNLTHLIAPLKPRTLLTSLYTTSLKRSNQRATLQRAFKKLLTRLNLPSYSLHQLRHTCFNQVYILTGDIRAVQQFAGHKSINSTLVYVHYNAQQIAQDAWTEALNTPQPKTTTILKGA